VENLKPRRQSNFSTARIRPRFPSWIRSSSVRPRPVALVAAGLRDDEPQVGVDHPLLGGKVATLDALGQLDLLLGGQQRMSACCAQEEIERVLGHGAGLASAPARLAGRAKLAGMGCATPDLTPSRGLSATSSVLSTLACALRRFIVLASRSHGLAIVIALQVFLRCSHGFAPDIIIAKVR
jgi:hypothetical protein